MRSNVWWYCAHPIERVWAALTTAQGLSRWFGSIAEIDLRPGGRAFFRWDDLDEESVATIALVDPPHRFAFRWAIEGMPEGDAPQTLVDFTLEPVPDGTRDDRLAALKRALDATDTNQGVTHNEQA
ncbi:SRPBCC family protein [Sinosporangium siamense]|uniref:SRPBCC family protein n=1 Tax=Sinosporangium siamense TaxID=1367973 RepID=UPI00194E2FC4|nr:SRPBCC domain-containing protein [Sinosporangium siamense]